MIFCSRCSDEETQTLNDNFKPEAEKNPEQIDELKTPYSKSLSKDDPGSNAVNGKEEKSMIDRDEETMEESSKKIDSDEVQDFENEKAQPSSIESTLQVESTGSNTKEREFDRKRKSPKIPEDEVTLQFTGFRLKI